MSEDPPPYHAHPARDPLRVPAITAPEYQARQSESAFMATVREAAERLGWLCVHWPNALYNPAGFPDLVCYRDGRCIHLELKTTRGRLGPKQREWCDKLLMAGFPVHVFRPTDWDEIEALLRAGR